MGSEARTRLGLIGLLVVTLFSFEQLYAEGDYFGPALLGMLAAMGLSVGARRLGLSTGLTFAGSAAVLLVYLGLVFAADRTLYGLPTPETISKLWGAITRAYEHSRIDYAPVPLRPGYALLTTAALWFATTLGEIATFRWRRPLTASIGPIALFSFLLILGTRALAPGLVAMFLAALLTYWGLESSHRVRAWGRWVPTWSDHDGRATNEPGSVTGGLARRMGAACVAAALVTPFFLPALEDGLLSFRNSAGDGPGFGTRGQGGVIDPLVSIVPELITQTEKELFTVRAEESSYWKLITLTDFDGERWTAGPNQRGPVAETGFAPGDIPAPEPSETLQLDVAISGLRGTALPLAGVPDFVRLEQDASGIPMTADLRTGDVETEVPLYDGLRYTASVQVANPSYRDMVGAEIGGDPFAPLLEIPPSVTLRVHDAAERWTRNGDTPFEKLILLQDRLRSYSYSLDVERSSTANYLETFLFETREGYCQQFATAFALLARTLGYPTRVAVGFLPGSATDEPGVFSVRGTDTHAWPEVLFEGLGWVRFEPTPRGEAGPPRYTVQPGVDPTEVRFGGGEATTESGGEAGKAGRVDNLEQGAVGRGGARRGSRVLDEVGGGGPLNREWQRRFVQVVIALSAAALLFMIVVPLLKQMRIRGAYKRATDARSRAAAAFREFESEAGELTAPRSRAESAAAYATRITEAARIPSDDAQRLAEIYEAAEYAPAPIGADLGAEAQALARRLRARLWSQASWWSRLQRLFSPAGLVGRA